MCQKPRFGTARRYFEETPRGMLRGNSLRNHLEEIPRGITSRKLLKGDTAGKHLGEKPLGYFSGPCPGGLPGCFIRDACLREGLSREEIPEKPSQRTLPREPFSGSPAQGVFLRESFPENPSQGVFPWEEFPLGRIPCVLSPRFCPWTGCSSDKNGRSFLLYWEGAKGGGGFGHLCG